MVEGGFYATTTLVGYKAGAGKSATSSAQAYTDEFLFEAESYINVATGKIWAVSAAAFATLDVGIRGLLTEAATNLAAIYVISYDMSGIASTFKSRIEAESMINVLYRRAMDCIKILTEKNNVKFMENA